MLDKAACATHNNAMNADIHIFSVHELTRFIKTTLERERPLQALLVRGEVSNCKYHTSGHLYFTLKDEQSSLPCVMWRERVLAQPFRCENGMQLTVDGNITVYERGGYYQLSAYSLQADGVGNLFLAFEQLKNKLAAEGLFAEDRKQPLPLIPRRIALLTSPTGAVLHDFAEVSKRRWPGRHITLVPIIAQGPMAAPSIVAGLKRAATIINVDVVVLARGGGSFEELACFNDETVARTIAALTIPVISAIGHETDFTIADFVADLRAPTPSAAAEIVVPDMRGMISGIAKVEARIQQSMRNRLEKAQRELKHATSHPALRDPRVLLRERQQAVDLAFERMTERFKAQLTKATHRLQNVEGRLTALDPRGVLQRGYTLVTDANNNQLIIDSQHARLAHAVNIQFHDGIVNAEIRE